MSTAQELFPFDLGDRRLDRRAAQIVQAALDNPGDSIPLAAGSAAATEATYRFFDNTKVPPAALDRAHQRYTAGLADATDGPLLIAQDTTPADFTSPARARTLGQLAHAQHFGFFVHSALAMTADGLPLGLLHQHVWMRPPEQRGQRKGRRHKETADKESQRWLDTEPACVAALPPARAVVFIADREADFYDYFALPRRPGLPLQAVLVEEVDPPPGVQPLRWLLLTTLPVASLEEAARVVRWYTYRWRIERYHFVLKSGCRLEELQLETAARLRRALALYALVAARLLHLTYRARQEPEVACEPSVSREEWEVLWRRFNPGEPLPAEPPSLRQAVRWIARLGGFLDRKGDGEPGAKVLWRGLRKLRDMVTGFRLAKNAAHGVQRSDE